MPLLLTDDQIRGFERDGYLVIEGFVDAGECQALRARAGEILDAFQPAGRASVFTTDEQARASDEEFLASGGGIHCFFEPEAVAPDGSLTVPKADAVNKIGHALHDLDPEFQHLSYAPRLAAIAADLGLSDALALQSMYIFKQPRIGGEVGCHQDATFLYTQPVSVMGFWFALEGATLDNGCLWVAPGGHHGPLRSMFRRTGRPAQPTEFATLDTTPLPTPPAGMRAVPVPAGTLVVLHGLLPHWSGANRSGDSRHAYSLHCISSAAEYPAWNWLQRGPDLPLRRLDRSSAGVR